MTATVTVHPALGLSPVSASKGFEPMKRCYHDHPAYPIAPGVVIYGGSCNSPAVHDADVYIGFDFGMKVQAFKPGVPIPQQIAFMIHDQDVPQDETNFRALIEWTAEQLKAGKKVHAGCIGGHGRTGLFFAALYAVMNPESHDAIQHVREHYCKKVVESTKQVNWLMKHYGVTSAPGSKAHGGGHAAMSGDWDKAPANYEAKGSKGGYKAKKGEQDTFSFGSTPGRTTGKPTNRAASIWG